MLCFSESEAEYTPDHCENQKCVILLSGHQNDTFFVTEHIDELKLYTRVVWFGDNLRYVTKTLLKQLSHSNHRSKSQKAFVVVHWTPSEIIDVDIEYETIVMPKCEEFVSDKSKDTMCKYELTPILKYCSKQMGDSKPAHSLFSIINFDRKYETYMLQMFHNMTDQQKLRHSEAAFDRIRDNTIHVDESMNIVNDKDTIYDTIACQFIQENESMFKEMISLPVQLAVASKRKVYIGGIFPKQEEDENEHFGK